VGDQHRPYLGLKRPLGRSGSSRVASGRCGSPLHRRLSLGCVGRCGVGYTAAHVDRRAPARPR
jgi:hypothetical protein